MDSQESSSTPQFKSIISSVLSLLYGPNFTSIQTTGKTIALTIQTFVCIVTSQLFNKYYYKWGHLVNLVQTDKSETDMNQVTGTVLSSRVCVCSIIQLCLTLL